MRSKLSRKVFEEHVLQTLLDKHADDYPRINARIKSDFHIVDDDGRPVEFTVGGSPQQESAQDIEAVVNKYVGEALDKHNKNNNSRHRLFGAMKGSHDMNNFKGHSRVFKGADADDKAARFGMWALACLGREKAKDWCANNDITIKAGQVEGTNTAGGYLVPDPLENDLIDLRLEYGVFRANAYHLPMTSDTAKRPRRTGGLTANFVGEATAGTHSVKSWDQVQLTAKKLMCLALVSSELNEDAVINVGDDLAEEMAYAFANKEDLCGFTGDATSAYGGIEGVTHRLVTINGSDDGGGLVLGSGSSWSALTVADFTKLISICPSYARRGAKWFISPTFCDSIFLKLITAAGGVTAAEMVNGVASRMFLGYPVQLTEVMPTTTASGQICALFGDLSKSSTIGDRRETTISFAMSGTVDGVDIFTTDQIGVRATERIDIVNHDLGSATVAGPVVGLITQ